MIVLCIVSIGVRVDLTAGKSPGDIKVILDQKIPLRDGVKVSARIWIPDDVVSPLPAVLVYTPYISDESQGRGTFFARNGYVYMSVDVPGRGNSEGVFYPLEGDKHCHELLDIISWIQKQPWSDSRVVMRGGSYRGMVQWQAMKTRPRGLVSIVPSDPVYPGIDFPLFRNIFSPYIAHWLSYTDGVTGNDLLFYDGGYWMSRYFKMYRQHTPFSQFWKMAGVKNRMFKKWLAHPYLDEYWSSLVPAPGDYKKITIPILSITGHFAGAQRGSLLFFRNHHRWSPKHAQENHYLVLGPWNHSGTRYPKKSLFGQTFGTNSMLDMDQLHLEWYDWHLKGKPRPEFLKDRVCYYVMGIDQWKYAPSLEAVSNASQVWYLSSENGRASDVFHSGSLKREKAGREIPDSIDYDPMDISPGERFIQGLSNQEGPENVFDLINDQSMLLDQGDAYHGDNLVYHSPPLNGDLEVSGFVTFKAYISLNVPDTDFRVSLYEIKPNGKAFWLTGTIMRARYRNSMSRAELVKPSEINLYTFDTFDFFSRRLTRGSRLRLVFGPLNSPAWEKNYNSGGIVAEESARDARKARITLYHDARYPSRLVLPVFIDKK